MKREERENRKRKRKRKREKKKERGEGYPIYLVRKPHLTIDGQ